MAREVVPGCAWTGITAGAPAPHGRTAWRGTLAMIRRADMASAFLARLASEEGLDDTPLLAAAAHPDDEVAGVGGPLARLQRGVSLPHVTDGASRDGRDMAAQGFSTLADYAAARRRELAAAMSAIDRGTCCAAAAARFPLGRMVAGYPAACARLARGEAAPPLRAAS